MAKTIVTSDNTIKKEHDWDDFSEKNFPNSDKYLPDFGDGDSMGTQAATALCKLIYKWFNDGDVYDNHYAFSGWCNDISGSANWLYMNIPETREILKRIKSIRTEQEYTELLYDLISVVDPIIPDLLKRDKIGDAYNEDGIFEFDPHLWDEEDEDDDYRY